MTDPRLGTRFGLERPQNFANVNSFANIVRSFGSLAPASFKTLLSTPQTVHPGSLLETATAVGSSGRYCRSAK